LSKWRSDFFSYYNKVIEGRPIQEMLQNLIREGPMTLGMSSIAANSSNRTFGIAKRLRLLGHDIKPKIFAMPPIDQMGELQIAAAKICDLNIEFASMKRSTKAPYSLVSAGPDPLPHCYSI
jgi:hypothetical protein